MWLPFVHQTRFGMGDVEDLVGKGVGVIDRILLSFVRHCQYRQCNICNFLQLGALSSWPLLLGE